MGTAGDLELLRAIGEDPARSGLDVEDDVDVLEVWRTQLQVGWR